ncbi:hypothetical protein CDCA_CDCA17G4446 [Cyanidium caldarium]|uniref:Sec1 family protein n=1 Tax=Cyanidium caldarium TaxID=2771 RepID=A0AAV9J2A7_CYACA|nr:hypothetical protein CDCA_CDCA17G4446 [Cyanidium caldarium]
MSSLRRSNEESVWRRALSQRDGRSPDGGSATVTDSRQARTVLGRLSQVRAAHQERALPANFESDESFSSEEASDDDVSTGEVTPSTSVPEGRVAKTESRPHSGTSVRASPPAPPTFTPSATHRAPTYASMVSPHASRSRRTPMERPGVRSVVRQRILERVIRETLASVRGLPLPPTAADASARTPSAEHGWLVLVLDQYAMRVVSAVMHMSDLLNEGVALVERHELPRERFPRMHAIFILQPCEQSVRILLDEDPTAYAGFHIYFLTPVPNKVMERFTQSPTDARPPGTSKREQRERRERAAKAQALRGRIHAFAELNLDFLASDEQAFSLDRRYGALHRLYHPERARMIEAVEPQVRQLLTVCSTLGVKPDVRYVADSPLAQWMAFQLCKRLDRDPVTRNLPLGTTTDAASAAAPPATTLLIVDRAFDPLAPLLHEFTYQAMVMDVASGLDRSKAGGVRVQHAFVDSGGRQRTEELLLDDVDNDAVFRRIRFLHMAEAIPTLTQAFQEFLAASPAAQLQARRAGVGSAPVDLKDLGAAIRALPQYREQLTRYSLHTSVASQCMRVFRDRALDRVAAVEQDLACGRDARGHRVKREALMEALSAVLLLRPGSVTGSRPADSARTQTPNTESAPTTTARCTEEERLRLLLLAVFAKHVGSCEAAELLDEQMMLQRAAVNRRRAMHALRGARALMAMRAPKAPEQRVSWWRKQMRRRQEKRLRKRLRQAGGEVPYDLSRYVPALQRMVEAFIRGRLGLREWPRVEGYSAAMASATQRSGDVEEVEVEDGDESASGESGDVKEEEAEERGSTTEMEVPRPQHQKSRSWTGKLSRAISRYRGGDAAESSGSGGGKHASALHTRSTSRGERAHRGTVSGAATTPPGGTRTSAAPTPRLVVFVAGGVTYSEMRAAIQAAAHHPQVEVVVGGSDWITPQDFIRALVALDDPAEAAALDRLPVDPELERALETTAAAATDAGERASAPVGNGQLSAATADGSATPSPTVSLWRRCLPCLAPPRTKESVS